MERTARDLTSGRTGRIGGLAGATSFTDTKASLPLMEHEPDSGQNTTPELIVRKLLHRMGYRYRLHLRIRVPPSTINNHPSTFCVRPDIVQSDHGGAGKAA